jgi:HlyD family secretion protein
MFKRLQILILVAILLIGAAALVRLQMDKAVAATITAPTSAPVAPETATIDHGDLLVAVSASGTLQPNQKVTLAFAATGKVASIPVEQGDHVLKGQVIATLDNQTALDAVLMAQAQVNTAQITLRRLTDKPRPVDVDVAKTALSLAQAQLDEALHSVDPAVAKIAQANISLAGNSLYLQQLTRDADQKQKDDLLKNPRTAGLANQLPTDAMENAALDAKQFNLQIAQASADAAHSQTGNLGVITAAQAQVTMAQNALDKLLQGGDAQDIARAQAGLQSAQAGLDQAKANLDNLKLVAPFDGLIAKLYLNLGQQVSPGPAAILVDTSSFYVDLPVNEVNIAQVALGQRVELRFDALPGQVFSGRVTRIGDAGTKSGGIVSYAVRVVIDPTNQPLFASMTATATLIIGKASDVVRIPNRFVGVDQATGKPYATVRQADGSYQAVELTLGLRNATQSEVKSGLKAGDVVILPQNQRPPL